MMMDTSLSLPQGGTPFGQIIRQIFACFQRLNIILMARGYSWEIDVNDVEVGGDSASLILKMYCPDSCYSVDFVV